MRHCDYSCFFLIDRPLFGIKRDLSQDLFGGLGVIKKQKQLKLRLFLIEIESLLDIYWSELLLDDDRLADVVMYGLQLQVKPRFGLDWL